MASSPASASGTSMSTGFSPSITASASSASGMKAVSQSTIRASECSKI